MGITWGQWWNYLRRQLFVMDTYSSPANARLNHAMLALHAYLSSALLAAFLLGAGFGFSVWGLGLRVEGRGFRVIETPHGCRALPPQAGCVGWVS